MNNEVILFVTFDREPDFSQLNEVHRHRKKVENSKVMMDQRSDHWRRAIRLPKHKSIDETIRTE